MQRHAVFSVHDVRVAPESPGDMWNILAQLIAAVLAVLGGAVVQLIFAEYLANVWTDQQRYHETKGVAYRLVRNP